MASMNEHAAWTEYCRCLCLLTVANSMEMDDDMRRAVLELSDYMHRMDSTSGAYDFVRSERPRLEGLLSKKCKKLDRDEPDDRLRPCPFCGGGAVIKGTALVTWVECQDCGMSTTASTRSYEAINRWQRRATDEQR